MKNLSHVVASSHDDEYYNVTTAIAQHRRFYGPNATGYYFYQNDDDTLSFSEEIITLLFLIMALFFLLSCAKSSMPNNDNVEIDWSARRQQRRAAARRRRREQRRKHQNPEKRKRFIDASLITKRVVACDRDLNLTLGEVPNFADEENGLLCPDNEAEEQDEVDNYEEEVDLDDDEDAAACVICLEAFRVGDDVTWSKNNEECLHVFHKDCIVPWLENPKHNDCPSCRCCIIIKKKKKKKEEEEEAGSSEDDDDSSDSDIDTDNDEEEEEESSGATATGSFSIINGLISRVRRASQRYSMLLGDDAIHDLNQQMGDHDEQDVEAPPIELRRVFSEGPPRRSRRLSYPPRRSSLLSTAYQRASELIFSSTIDNDVLDNDDDASPDEEPILSRTIPPLPPLRIRRVQSCVDRSGSSGSVLGSDYVIDRQEEEEMDKSATTTGNPKLPPMVPLRRSISLKRVRSVDTSNNQAEQHLCRRRTSDSLLCQKDRPRRRASRRRSCEESRALPPSTTIPLRRSISEQGGALRRTFFDG